MATPRRVLLTGVSRGLGHALAEEFARAGHTVVGCARSAAPLARLGKRWPRPHRFDRVDVTDARRVFAWAREVLDDGPPDLLVNNAAIINRNAALWRVPPEEFSAVIDVNVKGVAHVIAAFLPAMVERGRGVVVNFSSGWGRAVDAQVAPYCAAKWAVEGLTRALALELPRGMAAVPLNPGVIDTDMLRSAFGDEAGDYPPAEAWARVAAPFLLKLGPKDNGRPLTVPA